MKTRIAVTLEPFEPSKSRNVNRYVTAALAVRALKHELVAHVGVMSKAGMALTGGQRAEAERLIAKAAEFPVG